MEATHLRARGSANDRARVGHEIDNRAPGPFLECPFKCAASIGCSQDEDPSGGTRQRFQVSRQYFFKIHRTRQTMSMIGLVLA
jgi:hypothetical protein